MRPDDEGLAGETLTPLAEALTALRVRSGPATAVESVELASALGRILAEDVVATINVPPTDNSAVDGYAVCHDDLDAANVVRLPVVGRVAAGHQYDRPLRQGEALRILTGAMVPEGADTIVMQEDCTADGDGVTLPPGVRRGANLRKAGENVKAGTVILRAGSRLRPQDIGMAASVGQRVLNVRSPLRAAVFSTGDEVRDPASALDPGCIYDANRYIVSALLRGLGAEVTDLGILPDDPGTVRAALRTAAEGHHVLVTSGGVSLGEEDHVKAAVEDLGSLDVWRLAIKPGRPVAVGRIGDATFFGLPGNPVAAMVTFLCIARPVLLSLAGAPGLEAPRYRVRAAFDHVKKVGRREWLRARLVDGADGPEVQKYPREGSGILNSMVQSDGLVELAEDQGAVVAGSLVDYLPFSEVLA